MIFKVYLKNQYVEIFPNETIKIDERIDQVLDSVTFTFYSDTITSNIPPFTYLRIFSDNYLLIKELWISSEASFMIGSKGYWQHDATIYELTKITEALLVNSKAFSVVPGMSNYNSTYDRIRILTELMSDKYGYNFSFTSRILKMANEREYSFGSGTTFYDSLLELMHNEGCIPRITSYDPLTKTLEISCDDIESLAKNTNINILENISYLKESQSIDEYCSQLETEIEQTVDRDTISTVYLTIRSNENTIIEDNACLVSPNPIESIKNLSVKVPVNRFKSPTLYMDEKYFSYFPIKYADPFSVSNPIAEELVFDSDDYAMKFTNEGKTLFEQCKRRLGIYEGTDTHFYSGSLWYRSSYNVDGSKGVVFWFKMTNNKTEYLSSGEYYTSIMDIVLPKEKHDLLEIYDKPKFIYYQNGSEIIGGFNKTERDNLWFQLINQNIGNALEEYNFNYYNQIRMSDDLTFFEENETGYDILGMSTGITNFVITKDRNFMNFIYKLDYYPQCSICNIETKNEAMITARSYNNGANNIDYNNLIDSMNKEVNHLGLKCTIAQSTTYLELGSLTQYGYIVSRVTDIFIKNDQAIYTYYMYPNPMQIAEAIGVATQYEATNIPQKGIIKRHIFVDFSDSNFKETARTRNVMVQLNGNLALFTSKFDDGNNIRLTASALDNFTLAIQKKVSEFNSNYYYSNPIAYSDKNGYLENYTVELCEVSEISKNEGDNYPKITLGSAIRTGKKTIKIHKDPREMLVFTFKL